MDLFSSARNKMVERQLEGRGITNVRVLDCMGKIPRHAFVDPALAEFAYDDNPLPIAANQTISQPYIVALMLEAADLQPGDRVLDIGTGSSYAAAVAACLASQVDSIERHLELADAARILLDSLGITNVTVHHADGTEGLAEHAPFDAILAAAGGPYVPAAWRTQLKIGGRLVMPVGDAREAQRLVNFIRIGENEFEQEDLGNVMFVPLIGAAGWQEEPAVRDAPSDPKSTGRPQPGKRSLPDIIRASAVRLPAPDASDFAQAFDRFSDKRVVLLGDGPHARRAQRGPALQRTLRRSGRIDRLRHACGNRRGGFRLGRTHAGHASAAIARR